MRGLSYRGLFRSISRLLMPWLLASPGHQQPWYWHDSEIGKSLFYTRKDSNYLRYVMSVWRNDRNCEHMFMFLLKNLAHKELTAQYSNICEEHCITGSTAGFLPFQRIWLVEGSQSGIKILKENNQMSMSSLWPSYAIYGDILLEQY